MRVLTVLAALAVLVTSCSTPEPSRPSDSPAPSARPTPAVVLSKLAIAARFGEQGIRVSPNGEMLLVVEREGFAHTIYDLAGRSLATVRLGEIGMNPFWLPDSSGVVIGRRIEREAGGPFLLDVSILEPGGNVRDIAHRVGYPRAEGQLVSPDGSSLAFDTPCCPSSVVTVPRSGGVPREIATAPTQLHVLSWDTDGHVVYWAGGDAIDAVGADGSRYRVPLGLPSGRRALDLGPGARTTDGAATVISIQADGPFPGTSAQSNTADRTLVARDLRAYDTSAPLYMRLTDHEALTYGLGGILGAYDITTGLTRQLADINDDAGFQPTAMSAGTLMSSPGRSWVRVLDIAHDDQWHETDVGRILQSAGYALSRGRFLVFDEDGAPYVLDGVAARAAPSRTLASDSPNAVAGTVRTARNAVVGKKMELTWRLTDGTPQTLEYFGGSLVVVSLWTRPCIVCTQQLALLSDVTIGNRSRVEIIAVGVEESEASALEVAKDYRRLRPLTGSRDILKDLSPGLLPQTFVLDSDKVVRQVFFGPITWDALVRALTAASKSRLA
jgi:hypothetical protein